MRRQHYEFAIPVSPAAVAFNATQGAHERPLHQDVSQRKGHPKRNVLNPRRRSVQPGEPGEEDRSNQKQPERKIATRPETRKLDLTFRENFVGSVISTPIHPLSVARAPPSHSLPRPPLPPSLPHSLPVLFMMLKLLLRSRSLVSKRCGGSLVVCCIYPPFLRGVKPGCCCCCCCCCFCRGVRRKSAWRVEPEKGREGGREGG